MGVAYPEEFPPGMLLGPFINFCEQRKGTANQLLNAAEITELRDLLDYANKFHHDTNAAWETDLINDQQLVHFLILQRRVREARTMFECLLALRNDVGLLAAEYGTRCQMGNFPQAFSHVALVNTAYNFTRSEGPAEVRAGWGTQMTIQAARTSVPFNRRLLSRIRLMAQ